MAIVCQLHVLGKVQAFNSGNVPDIKEPNIGENLAFKDETSHNAAEDINIDLEVGSGINQSKLKPVSENVNLIIEHMGGHTGG